RTQEPESDAVQAEAGRPALKVLVVDDEPTLAQGCASILQLDGHTVTICTRGEEAQELIRRQTFDLLLLDLYMSTITGMELLRACLSAHPETIVVVMTGNPSVESSLEALRAGAWDYIPKPFSAEHLRVLVGRAAHTVGQLRRSHLVQTGQSDRQGSIPLLGVSPAFKQVVQLARRVARTDASVFITGESGSGKEVIAQYIHQNSRRSSRSLVALNCAALPEALLESEMFGHVKGAFTGAVVEKEGLLETADGSTLFLDELTEMPLAMQAKLLRVIQDGIVRRVGSTVVNAQVDIRFIAATNRDPQEAIEGEKLRRDLFYRLRVVPLHIAPLRDRQEDIPILAEHFLTAFWARHRRGEEVPSLGPAAIRTLQRHPWPGNVRELQNVIEHAVVLLEPGTEVQPEELPLMDSAEIPAAIPGTPMSFTAALDAGQSYHELRDQLLADFERKYLVSLISQAGGSISKAARMAGVDRTTLYRFMERHGLQRRTALTTA
ncbi:MAG TPA: sigma-54 dependent transcriptional regulator, partial [Longimicrobiales bacterium]